MKRSELSGTLAFALAVGWIGATAGMAGPLEPPAGPVTSTGRFGPRVDVATLPGDATATRIISQSGSYYLSSHLIGQAGRVGIRIAANAVTLDLGGNTLAGVPGSLAGISLGDSDVISIFNGKVLGWGGDGMLAGSSDSVTIRDVTAFGNAGWGMALFGAGDVTVDGCTVTRNLGPGGIQVGDTSLVINSVVGYNNGDGISANAGVSVLDNVVTDNTGTGIRCAFDCLIRGNTSQFNAVNISAPASTIIENHP